MEAQQILASPQHKQVKPPVKKVRFQPHWGRFFQRLLGLPEGRHMIILTVANGEIDWTELGQGKVEK